MAEATAILMAIQTAMAVEVTAMEVGGLLLEEITVVEPEVTKCLILALG